jgi:hypothetical protein
LYGHPTSNAREPRWFEFISEYYFEIEHIKDKENQVVDALGRRVHEMCLVTINMYSIDLKDKILEAANSYQHYLKIKETLYQGNFQYKFNYYEMKEDGILMYRGKVYVSNSRDLKSIVLK